MAYGVLMTFQRFAALVVVASQLLTIHIYVRQTCKLYTLTNASIENNAALSRDPLIQTWPLISIMLTKTKTLTLSTMTKATISYVVLDVYLIPTGTHYTAGSFIDKRKRLSKITSVAYGRATLTCPLVR